MNHRSAPVEVREKISFPSCAGRKFLRELKESGVASEAVLISTCNRTEVYAVVEHESDRTKVFEALAADRDVSVESLYRDAYWLTDADAVRHLYRVASSLDSMVLGEAQILGQVRRAYRTSTEERCAGPVLHKLFHNALRVGKDVRTETGIGDNSLSVARVAVKLAENVFGTLSGRKALVLGAGEMSELVVNHLKDSGIGEIRVANRTAERAQELAGRVGGRPVEFENLAGELPEVDVVVSSTGSGDWVIGGDIMLAALENRTSPLFFIDIAVPRDVDPVVQSLEQCYLYDIDDLQAVVERNADDREAAAARGEAMISPEVVEYMNWLSTLHVIPLIKELRSEAERVRRHEVARTLKKADLSPEEEAAVERLSHSLVNKLLHGPIAEIKALAESGSPVESAEVRRRALALEGLGVELYRSSNQ